MDTSPEKVGSPQNSCNNNFTKTIKSIVLASSNYKQPIKNNNMLLKEWLPLVTNKNTWNNIIDEYFESCKLVSEIFLYLIATSNAFTCTMMISKGWCLESYFPFYSSA
jgi:hypothetical protein